MSLDLNVYVEKIDDQIIPLWMKEMNQFDMECEIHPDFSFNDHSGFLPFKVKLNSPYNSELKGQEMISGFEFYKETFSFEKELEQVQPKRTIIQSVFQRNIKKVNLVNPEIDSRLSKCNWIMIFNWGSNNSLELRMLSLSSAIITKLSDGVCCYPADDIWYDNKTIIENAFKEALEYEKSLRSSEWKVHKFNGWNE